MAARPWECVPPIEEIIAPNMITTTTSHRMPSAAPLGRQENEARQVMACS